MDRNFNVAVNIAADGLAAEVIQDVNAPESAYQENIKTYIAAYLQDTRVGRMLFNVCYKRSIADSDVMDSVLYNVKTDKDGMPVRDERGTVIKEISPVCTSNTLFKGYREMAERGIDIVKMAIAETHQYGAEAWLSIRMNDHHFEDDPAFNSTLSYARAAEVGVCGSKKCLDYTKQAVQNYYREYIKELCTRYDIDGIELDFLRSCPIMTQVNAENIQALNRYVDSIKKETIAFCGRKVRFSARVYSEEAQNLSYGIDAAQWVANGSIDTLVPEAWFIPTYYRIPMDAWRKSIDAKNTDAHAYTLLAGTDWAVRCDSRFGEGYMMWLTLEQFKGFASSAYHRGADGIYLFNHFAPRSAYGALTTYMDENGRKVRKNILHQKLLAAESKAAAEQGLRTYVHTCRDAENDLYPITLAAQQARTINIHTGSKIRAGYYRVILGLDEAAAQVPCPVEVCVNGIKALQLEDYPREKDFVWKKGTEKAPIAELVSEVAFRVMQFEITNPESIRDGENEICMKSLKTTQAVKWLEVQVLENN